MITRGREKASGRIAGDMVQFFDPIVIPPPRREIFRRLGFRKGITRLASGEEEETVDYIDTALSLIRLRGAARRMAVRERNDAAITLEGSVVFESRRVAAFLDRCPEILLMGATAGSDIMAAIQQDTTGDHVTRGVVLDATASVMVDSALDWIMGYFRQAVRRENRILLPKRYSAGYGDFLLANQKTIFHLLQLDRIGVQISDSCILLPEKSVTAVTGIC
jgi:hypothetical protein